MSDGMGREPAYLSSHATNRYFIPNWGLFTTIHAEAKQKPPNRETEIHTHNARFTSRLFATLLFLNCYFASWRAQEARRRYEGYKRPAPSAGLVGLN